MNRRQISIGLGASVLALAGCATSKATNAGGEGGRYAVTRLHDVPRGSGERLYDTYALFIATNRRLDTVVTPALSEAFLQFSSAMWGDSYGAFIGDARTAALDVGAGRRLLDRVNRNYGMSLRYEDGPFVVVLQHHPLRRKDEGDQAIVIEFADKSTQAMANSLSELSLRMPRKGGGDLPSTRGLGGSVAAWFAQFAAGVKEGFTNGQVHTSQDPPDREHQ